MLSIGTTHVNAWRGFNFGQNDGSVEHQLENDDDHPRFIASSSHFIAGHNADYSKPKISTEDERW